MSRQKANTMTTNASKSDLVRDAQELARLECAVETNDGTFGAEECCRKTGSGDSAFGKYTIYERVGDGTRRVVGCDPANAPGYARVFAAEINAQRARLSALREQIRAR